jgi:hypothetical protein
MVKKSGVDLIEARIVQEFVDYDFKDDRRLLIPFMIHNKIGFLNRNKDCVVEPKYDTFIGNCYSEKDLIKVGIQHSYAYERKNRHPDIYTRYKYGIMNAFGECVIEPQFSGIIIGSKSLIVRRAYGYDYDGAHALLDLNGNVIIPFGVYSQIEPFNFGLARCKNHVRDDKNKHIELHGLINELGETILECNKRLLPPFYGKYANARSKQILAKIIKEERPRIDLSLLGLTCNETNEDISKLGVNDYGSHYGEFAGSYAQDVMGYSDDVINDAFEGDPDAYWNID